MKNLETLNSEATWATYGIGAVGARVHISIMGANGKPKSTACNPSMVRGTVYALAGDTDKVTCIKCEKYL